MIMSLSDMIMFMSSQSAAGSARWHDRATPGIQPVRAVYGLNGRIRAVQARTGYLYIYGIYTIYI